MILFDLHRYLMMIFGNYYSHLKLNLHMKSFRLRIFKLQAQIICNDMEMTNDQVQEYQVEFLFFISNELISLFDRNF